MATIFYPDGATKQVAPTNGDNFSLAELCNLVGGYIELINTRDGKLMVLNEEGKLLDLPYNEKATQLIKNTWNYIVGTVLVCEQHEVQ